MNIDRFVTVALVLCLMSSPVSAAAAPSVKKDLANFQTICLKSNELCYFTVFDFSGDGDVRKHTVAFVPLASQAEATYWNHKAKERLTPTGTTDDIHAAAYDAPTRSWKPLAASRQCPLCVPDSVRFEAKARRWFRFETTARSRWQREDGAWIYTRAVDRGDQEHFYVVVRSHGAPTVCASVRNSGMHYQYATAKSRGFRVLLNSRWVQSERPDYVTVSPVCSWQSLARHYMAMQDRALAGSDQLPTFTGTVQQKVDAAIGYIKSRGIGYDEKPDPGGYPNQDVSKILKMDRTDCKGFTTLLYSLLRKSGVESHPILLNAYGMTPLSFSVPDHWSDHVILYVPSLHRYIDLTVSLPSRGKYTWQTSADSYAGDVVLDLVTGRFGVVSSHSDRSGG